MLLVQEKVAHIGATLDRVERFDAKLRTAVSSLQDPVRNLAIGPVGTSEPETVPAGPVPAAEQNLKALPGKLGTMEADAARSE